jgi:hypothetical protein
MATYRMPPSGPRRTEGGLALLVPFTASALAVAGAAGWLGRSDSGWVTAGAVVLVLVLSTLLGWRLVRWLGPTGGAPLPRVASVVPAVAAVGLLVPLGVVQFTQPTELPSASPAGTVRGFLGAVVDDDGVAACPFLSDNSRLELEGGPARLGPSCESFFAGVDLRIGGATLTSDGQLDRLHYTTTGTGERRQVVVSGHGGQLRFRLRPATVVERKAFFAPSTPWRIDSSVNGLG